MVKSYLFYIQTVVMHILFYYITDSEMQRVEESHGASNPVHTPSSWTVTNQGNSTFVKNINILSLTWCLPLNEDARPAI